jgi:hypothetical protein
MSPAVFRMHHTSLDGIPAHSGSAHMPLSRDNILWGAIAIVVSVATGAVALAGGDNLGAAIGFVGILAVACATVYRLEWGVYLFVGTFLLIDQFEVPEFSSLTYKSHYFDNLNTNPYLPQMDFAAFSPLDLHLALLFAVWAARFVFRINAPGRAPALWIPATVFLAWMGLGFVAGSGRGGDMTAALWELRGLGYLFLAYAFVPQVIRTEQQIRTVVWICIAAIAFKAFEGSARFIGEGFGMGGHDAMLTHEDPVFIITLWVLLMGFVVFGARNGQRTTILVLLPVLLLGFYAANRRAAFASLGVSLLAFAVLVPPALLKRLARRAVPFLAIFALYAVIFWGSASPLASPLNQIRSGFVDDEQELGERNYYSNLYRKLENFNLAFTIRSYPLEGIGFGTKYFQPLELVKINYALRDYMAHNNILWLLVKVGAIGFFIFWFFITMFGARAAQVTKALQSPYLQAVAAMVLVAVINQLVAAYFDLHLVRYRTNLYMGTLMGLLPALTAIVSTQEKAAMPDATLPDGNEAHT